MRRIALLSVVVLAFSRSPLLNTKPSAGKAAHQPGREAVRSSRRRRPWAGTAGTSLPASVTDKDIRAAADQMVATGMKDAGYIYINIDDTWEGERDASGVLHTNSKFPDMKALADYVHSKGLKTRHLLRSPGPRPARGFAGSLDHEAQDAQLYASWGIDYLKYDLCSYIPDVMQKQAPGDKAAQMRLMIAAYDKMGKALKASGPADRLLALPVRMGRGPWEWAPALGGNLWRTTGDIAGQLEEHLDSILNEQAGLAKYAGPGHWNDPDMLEVGNGRLTLAENRAHFSMWAMLAAPLLAGNDLPNMKPEIKAILTNKDVIAIDQDKLGSRARAPTPTAKWKSGRGQLSGGAMAIAVLNAASDRYATHPFHLSLAKLGLHGPLKAARTCGPARRSRSPTTCRIEIPSHDILLVRIGAAK